MTENYSEEQKMIPKTIYYVWFGSNPLPLEYKEYIKGWKKLNPDFQIKCINESNFDVNKYRFTKEAYKAKKWAFVSDVARLEVIYNNGGIYLDTDVELLKPLDSLLKYKSVWALENSDSINSGLIIGAEKENRDIKNILRIYKNLSFDNPNGVNIITVSIISDYFLKHGFVRKNKLQVINNDTLILPVEYFAPLHYWGGGHVTKRTMGIHRYGASWQSKEMPGFFSKFAMKREAKLIFPTVYFMLKDIFR